MKVPASTRTLRTGEVVELRSPTAADAAAVLACVRGVSADAMRNMNHPPAVWEAITIAAEETFLEQQLAHPKAFFLAAFHGGAVVGTASLRPSAATFSPHCADLGMAVAGAYRGKGLGRALLEALVTIAEDAGVWNLELRVRTFNAPAIALYESLGFRRVGTLEKVVSLPEGLADEYVYQRVRPPRES